MKPLILKGHTRPLTCVKYNREGDLLLTTSKDNVPTLWYADTGERIGTYDGHKGTVWWVDISRDSSMVITGGADMTVKLWRTETGELLTSFTMTGPVRSVAFGEGDKSFFAVTDPFRSDPVSISVYDIADDPEQQVTTPKFMWNVEDFGAPDVRITRALWGPLNRYILTGDSKGTIRLHDPSNGAVQRSVEEHTNKIQALSFNKEKTLLITGSADCNSKLFETSEFRCIATYETSVPVNAAVISPIKEHVLVAGGQDAMNVTTTSTRAGKFETKFFHRVFAEEFGIVRGHFGPVNSLAFHPEGIGFTSGAEDGYIRVHKFDKDYFEMHSELDDLSALEALSSSAAPKEAWTTQD